MAKAGTALVRVVNDLIVVAGAMPSVSRVLDFKTVSVTDFEVERVEGQFFQNDARWPSDLFTPGMLIYPAGQVVTSELLTVVDVLQIWSGSGKYATSDIGLYLWQREVPPRLHRLSLVETRAALQSPWVRQQRSTRPDSGRGIILRS